MRITLIVCGSIAVFKAVELLRELVKRGHVVRVIMSEGATKFLTPLTFQILSGHPVSTSLWDLSRDNVMEHISLADECDLVLVAPATANIIAKIATGLSDDLPSAVALATKARIVVAPAMNPNMWENPVTRHNIAQLKERLIKVVEPESGELACGWEGKGRLASLENILLSIEGERKRLSLTGKQVVVTAGPTYEMIDPIRFISNRSSGRTGLEIALAAHGLGAEVILLSSVPNGFDDLTGIKLIPFCSAEDLRVKLLGCLSDLKKESWLFMAAAPADFRPEQVSEHKLKQPKEVGHQLSLLPNPDILRELNQQRADYPFLKTIIGFCAESENLERNAREKLKRKGSDYIVGNLIQSSVGQETTELLLIARDGRTTNSGRLSKKEAAIWLLNGIFH